MNCKEIQSKLTDYLDQTLDAASTNEIREHLETCQDCNREAQEIRLLLATMKDTPLEEPPPVLRESFDTMLQSELNMLTTANIIQEFPAEEKPAEKRAKPGRILGLTFTSPIWRVAAAVILLAGGIGIGMTLRSRPAPEPSTNETLIALRQEVKEMKEEVMLNMIDDESASQRIKAVGYAEQMASPDNQVVDVLINTLNHDKNVNVRLAALYSLARFADRRSVRDSLVGSLRIQTEPIVQVVLINLLAEKRDTRAIAPIHDIMTDKKTLKEVKDAAQRSLKEF